MFVPSLPHLQYFDRKHGYALTRAYFLASIPTSTKEDADLHAYLSTDDKSSPTSRLNGNVNVLPGGVNIITVDMEPGASTPLHRTISVDAVVIVEGKLGLSLGCDEEVELLLG